MHLSLEIFVGLLLVMSSHLYLVTQGDFQSSEGQFDSEKVLEGHRYICDGIVYDSKKRKEKEKGDKEQLK